MNLSERTDRPFTMSFVEDVRAAGGEPSPSASPKPDLPATAPSTVQPFLRWAGGKRWLAPKVLALLGSQEVTDYREPFLGGGAVFLALAPTAGARLSDANGALIATYAAVRDNPTEVAARLARHENSAEYYYALRSEVTSDAIDHAARFIFLNRTSYNGIYRENMRGVYNVPYGRKTSPRLPTERELVAISRTLRNAQLVAEDFEAATRTIGPGGFVYLDPPYTIAHDRNGFVKYNQHLFSWADQERLARVLDRAHEQGWFYVLSNAHHSTVRELFARKSQRVFEVSRQNLVGGAGARRGQALEYLFTNLPARE